MNLFEICGESLKYPSSMRKEKGDEGHTRIYWMECESPAKVGNYSVATAPRPLAALLAHVQVQRRQGIGLPWVGSC